LTHVNGVSLLNAALELSVSRSEKSHLNEYAACAICGRHADERTIGLGDVRRCNKVAQLKVIGMKLR
jgi:hypothetical protein